MDKYTSQKIQKLHPSVRDEVTEIINKCNAALKGRAQVRVTQGFRTFAEQEALYAIGRLKIGKKVTNAQPGESIHNYGFAIDICLVIDGETASWDTLKNWDEDQIADWKECVIIFIQNHWIWGGNWKTFKDFPHFEKTGFNDWKKLSKMKKDKNGYIQL